MTDRPTGPRLDPRDPRSTDPRYADDPRVADPRYADPRTAPTLDERPRVVHEDGRVEEPLPPDPYRAADERPSLVDRPGPAVPVDERPRRSDGRRPLAERGLEHRDEVFLADPARVREREEDAMGGIKWGSAFFGWLTAMGVAALLTALLAAAGTALAVNNSGTTSTTADLATTDSGTAQTIGITGAVAVLVIMFVAYLAGGYVAGRMARIDGPRQGLGVWIWMIVLAVVAALVATVAGTAYDVLGRLNTFPRIPLDGTQLATAGLVTLLLALAVSLVGAMLGGAAGMGYHRRMDAVGLGLLEPEVDVRRP
ncbi:MAG: hypothetical protein U0R76_12780 [Candidatus Nanopelagicales bacterium]